MADLTRSKEISLLQDVRSLCILVLGWGTGKACWFSPALSPAQQWECSLPLQNQPCICGCVVSVYWVLFPSQPKFPVGVRTTSAIGLGQWEAKGFVAGAVQCCENPPSANKRCSALYLNLTFFLSSIVIPQPKIIEKQYKLSCLS